MNFEKLIFYGSWHVVSDLLRMFTNQPTTSENEDS